MGVMTMPLTLSSPSFADGGGMPSHFTCDGPDRSPDLAWSGIPAGTRSLALTVTDPDAPHGTWVHWVVYNLPADCQGLNAGAAGRLPPATCQGRNDWQRTGYGGPCPPAGRHRYVHTLYALDTVLPDLGAPTAGDLQRAMRGHVLTSARLTGTYQRASA
jgi:Raf kinase inhibitor-like YbhB/YbcL family protein